MIIFIIALFNQHRFWKAWSICSAIAIPLNVAVGCYMAYQMLDTHYAFEPDWTNIAIMAFTTPIYTLADFGFARLLCVIFGRPYWRKGYQKPVHDVTYHQTRPFGS